MKFNRLALVLFVCFTLSACGGNSSDGKSNVKAQNPKQEATASQGKAENAQVVKTQAGKEQEDTSYLKKMKCPENAKKMLFASDWSPLQTTNFDILSVNDDGTEITRLTDRSVWEGSPVWSADRCRIAYSALTDSKNEFDKDALLDIYVMDPDGSNRVRLTSTKENDDQPDWSPDGKRIVFMSERDKNREIYVMSSKGTDQERLTNSKANDEHPHWSPNNDRIVFSTHRDGNWEIYLMDLDGSNLVNLTKNKADDKDSAWSPDGNQIAFISNRSGIKEIYIMDKDGSNVRQVTRQNGKKPTIDQDIAWSPDGQWLAFAGTVTSKEGKDIQAIYKISLDGSKLVKAVNRDPSTSNSVEW